MATIQSLLTQAAVIRDATAEGENTALRVGSLFVSLIQAIVATLPSELLDASGISYSAGESNFRITFNAVSSDGSTSKKQIIIPAASQDNAGLLTPAKLKEVNDAVASVADCLTKVNQANAKATQAAQAAADATTAITNNAAAIEELKADPHRHVVISLVKLNNWQDKELADALGFLWDYTQQHTLFINVGTVIVFHSPTEGWVSYQWRHQTVTDAEANVKNPANWERYTPKAEDLAKLEALPAKAEIDAAIEAASRQWLIDQAVAAGATYNTSTGKFSYGPTGYVISDIGDDEMLRMLQCRVVGDGFTGSVTPCFGTLGIRINFSPCNEVKDIWPEYQQVCHTNNDIEVLLVEPYGNRAWRLTKPNGLQNCAKLRYVSGGLLVDSCNIDFTGLPELEHLAFRLRGSYNVNIKDSPKLNLASLQAMADRSMKLSSTATVTVHPTVYAKLTDTTNTQWHKVLTDALAKNITFATTE